MRVLVFGKTGQVATELQRFDVVTALVREDADLNDTAACMDIIANTDADAWNNFCRKAHACNRSAVALPSNYPTGWCVQLSYSYPKLIMTPS